MKNDIAAAIAGLRERAVEYQKNVCAPGVSPNQVGQLQAEFATMISGKMGELIAAGATAADIQQVQDLLRAAFEPMSDSHAPKASGDAHEEYEEIDLEDINTTAYLFAADLAVIEGFENGQLSEEELLGELVKNPPLALDDSLEIIDLIANDYDDGDSLFAGNVIAGPDGEAIVPDPLLIQSQDYINGIIAQPLIHQAPDEVSLIAHTLANLSARGIEKGFDLKKLAKAGAFTWHDDVKELKSHKDEILAQVLADFERICALYASAAAAGKCIVLML